MMDELRGCLERGGTKEASLCESSGGRLRFRVELRFGETKIVSWKKLLREAASSEPEVRVPSEVERQSVPQPQSAVPLPSRQIMEKDPKDAKEQAGSSRLSSVIERIERMYAGDGSSEEEALDNVPYDDEYDTNDSFIDDAELDDYFQVDNSAIKHDGFFVNRGKLERIEPVAPDQQLKKRRRKDLVKVHSGNNEGYTSNKNEKLGDKVKRQSLSVETSLEVAMSGVTGEAAQFQDSICYSETLLKRKTGNAIVNMNPIGVLSVDSSRKDKDTNQQRPEKWKDSTGLPDASSQRSIDKNIDRRAGPIGRPRSMMLDKAIKELEKTVAESRPPSTEVRDRDNSSHAVKKRLTPEIKLKLAKVARLAQAVYGVLPKDLVNRLMSIVGHLMQVRSLKRNLRVMAKVSFSAKQEKDGQIQRLKQEFAEMVKHRYEQRAASSDDIQGGDDQERFVLKQKFRMDEVLEDKICELYDLYVEGIEEDSRPPVKRLYQELMLFWPRGQMDTEGIKRAIRRAKERKVASSLRGEKIKKRRPSTPKEDPTTPILTQTHNNDLVVDSEDPNFSFSSEPVVSLFRSHPPAASSNSATMDKMMKPGAELPKTKMEKKQNGNVLHSHSGLEKLAVLPSEEWKVNADAIFQPSGKSH